MRGRITENVLLILRRGTVRSEQVMLDCILSVAKEVAEKLEFRYDQKEAQASRYYLEHVYHLPKDAKQVF